MDVAQSVTVLCVSENTWQTICFWNLYIISLHWYSATLERDCLLELSDHWNNRVGGCGRELTGNNNTSTDSMSPSSEGTEWTGGFFCNNSCQVFFFFSLEMYTVFCKILQCRVTTLHTHSVDPTLIVDFQDLGRTCSFPSLSFFSVLQLFTHSWLRDV